jgi:hypothetical protein
MDYWNGILEWNTVMTFEPKFNHKNLKAYLNCKKSTPSI